MSIRSDGSALSGVNIEELVRSGVPWSRLGPRVSFVQNARPEIESSQQVLNSKNRSVSKDAFSRTPSLTLLEVAQIGRVAKRR